MVRRFARATRRSRSRSPSRGCARFNRTPPAVRSDRNTSHDALPIRRNLLHRPQADSRGGATASKPSLPDGSGGVSSVELDVTDPAIWLDTQVGELKAGLDLASDVIGEITRIVGDHPPSHGAARRPRAAAGAHPGAGQSGCGDRPVPRRIRNLQATGRSAAGPRGGIRTRLRAVSYLGVRKTDEVTATVERDSCREPQRRTWVCDNLGESCRRDSSLPRCCSRSLAGSPKPSVFSAKKSPYTGPFRSICPSRRKPWRSRRTSSSTAFPGSGRQDLCLRRRHVVRQYCENSKGRVKGLARVEYIP